MRAPRRIGGKNLAHDPLEIVKILKTRKMKVLLLNPTNITTHGKCWIRIENPILGLFSL